ncbi:RBBP9/YdeN family alpha/beta hydrolase [Microbacterium testaceum]|uniref:RBBP9/YdeN family alpha/beta hydrolase n=1 Tax=Microbacterium testaceum TaxID=2033 RepID=UPI003815DF6A
MRSLTGGPEQREKQRWSVVGYVIVPGIGGSDDAHWQTRWEQQWGDETAVRIEPGSWSQPHLQDWVGAIARAFEAVRSRCDGVVLITHSLGCWAAAEWLQQGNHRHPRGALLVAPPDPTDEAFPADAAPTFLSVAAHPLRCPSVVVASTNDPYCDLRVAEELARSWGSDLQVAGALGHLNSASGLGEWPAGREVLDRLVSL